eukprot:3979303-Amphidinium_carterae.1
MFLLKLERLSQGFQCQQPYVEVQHTDKLQVQTAYLTARATRAGPWLTAWLRKMWTSSLTTRLGELTDGAKVNLSFCHDKPFLTWPLPKEGLRTALLPHIYKLWSAACRPDVLAASTLSGHRRTPCWERCSGRDLDLAYITEDSQCCLDKYSGSRCILVQGEISDSVIATCGLPPGCGHAVDMFHACLPHQLPAQRWAKVEVRKWMT